MIEIDTRPSFVQMPNSEVNKIAQMHAKNGFNLKATASQLGMRVGDFTNMIVTHVNLRIAICQQRRLHGIWRPYGLKRGEFAYEDGTEKD